MSPCDKSIKIAINWLSHDSDGNVGVCDGRSSFYSKYDDDDDGRRHQNKKCHHRNDWATPWGEGVNSGPKCCYLIYDQPPISDR